MAENSGGMAMDAYHKMCSEKDSAKLEDLRFQMKEYCKRDTEAMVLLFQCLEGIVSKA